MQFSNPATLLSSTDYARLQRLMLTMIGSRTVMAALLRRKLGSSAPAPSSSLSSNRAVSGKRVRFSIDGGREEERVLAWQPPRSGDRNTLSLLSPRGLALMGLTPGESLFYRTESDRTEFIRLENVSSEGATGHGPPVPVHGRAPQVSARPATEDSMAGAVNA